MRLLDRLEPSPALVLNRLGDLLAWTVAYEALAGPVGILDGDPPNLALFTFCDPRARDAFPDWATVADEQVGHLRSVCPTAGPEAERLLARLVDSGADFADRWSSPVLARRRTGVTRFAHPEAGELRLAFETLDLGGDDQWLIAYLPADESTGVAVDLVTGRRPGGLRAVGD